jgi:hypothetical protein
MCQWFKMFKMFKSVDVKFPAIAAIAASGSTLPQYPHLNPGR